MDINDIRKMTPSSHVVIPVKVVEILIDTAYRAYLPAFMGSEVAVMNATHAATTAQNVINRMRIMRHEQNLF